MWSFRAKLENSASSRRPEALAHQLPRDSERGRRRARAEPKETKGAEVEEKEDGKKWGGEKEKNILIEGRGRESTRSRAAACEHVDARISSSKSIEEMSCVTNRFCS